MSTKDASRKTRILAVRVDGEMHAVLAAAAKRAEIQRAMKTSRDASPQGGVRISRNG